MMAGTPMQSWCIRCQYEGKKPFLFGTLVIERSTSFDDREKAMIALLHEHLAMRPAIIGWMPGALIFHEAG